MSEVQDSSNTGERDPPERTRNWWAVVGLAMMAAGGILVVIGIFGVSAASGSATPYSVSFDLASCRGTGGGPLIIDPATGAPLHCSQVGDSTVDTDTDESKRAFTEPDQDQILSLAGDLADDGHLDDADQKQIEELAADLAARHGFDQARSDQTIARFTRVMVAGFALVALGLLTKIVATFKG